MDNHGMITVSPQVRKHLEEAAKRDPRYRKLLATPPVDLIPVTSLPAIKNSPCSDLLIITVATAKEGAGLHAITGRHQRAYADKCGADYVVIDGPSIYPKWTMYDKFRCFPYMQQYQRVLYLDADVFVTKECPSLFELYPDDVIAMHDDTGYQGREWDYLNEVKEVCESQRLPVPESYRLLNSGVALVPGKWSHVWAPPIAPIPKYWCAEQHLEVIRILNERLPWVPLPSAFNWMWWIGKDGKYADPTKFIIHAAGYTGMGGTAKNRTQWLVDRIEEHEQGLPFLSIARDSHPKGLKRSLPMAKQCTHFKGVNPPKKKGCGDCSTWQCAIKGEVKVTYCTGQCDDWEGATPIGFSIATPTAEVIPFLDTHPELFDQPPRSLHGFENWPNVIEAFKQAWPSWIANTPPQPPFNQYAPRGVVIIGGGERYEIGLYVACRMLRHHGWTEPIMLWHRGDWEPIHAELFTKLDVTVIDAVKYRDQFAPCRRWGMDKWSAPDNRWGGWGLKSYAVLHSPFTQVFYQDADWYLAAPAERLGACFDIMEKCGSLVWYDTDNGNDSTVKWHIHGATPDKRGRGFQGGQWMIDKSNLKVWQALNLYRKLDDYSDYYYRHHYGDQDSFRLAWAMADAPRTSLIGRCWLRKGGMLARGTAGEFLGVHRIADKQFQARLTQMPLEKLAQEFAGEYRRLIAEPPS